MTSASTPTVHRAPLSAWLAALALLASIIVVYWPGRGGGFVLDDQHNITRNVALHVTTLDWPRWVAAMFSSPASMIQRPLAMLTFAVNHYFTGLDPVPMKLTNLAIHLLNTVLVLGLVRCLLGFMPATAPRREWAPRFVAAAWALHPINMTAVLYVVQRMESLSHTFVFAGLWLYLLGRRRQQAGAGGWGLVFGGLAAGTGLGLLSKESAVLLPLYAFCAEACLLGFRTSAGHIDRGLRWMYVGVLLLPALLGAAWLWPAVSADTAYASRDFSLAERLLTESRVVLDYLRWIVVPDLGQLSLYHDDYVVSRGVLHPPSTLLALFALPTLLGVAYACRRQRPLVSLGLLWFLGAQLLTATIIPLELAHEHRNYFASLGICLIAADLLLLAPRRESARRIGALTCILIVLALAGLTHLRAREWSNPLQFQITEAAKHPRSPRASYELARALITLTGYRRDSPLLADTWRALEKARRANRSGILPHQAALILASHTENLAGQDRWWKDMQSRLRDQPLDAENLTALITLVDCAADGTCRFPPEAMMATFAAALENGPHPVVLSVYGKYALHVLGDRDLALRLWRDASAFAPDDTQFRYNLARLLIELRRFDEARAQIAELRARGRLGQNEVMSAELETRLRTAAQASVQK